MTFFKSPVAATVPYDNTVSGFSSENVQDAIEEAQAGVAVSRYTIYASTNANANSVRFLEFVPGLTSDSNPFIVPKNCLVKDLTLVAGSNSTGTVSILKNNVSVETISLSASRIATKINLSVSFLALDEMSVTVSSGSISKPLVTIFIQNEA